MGVPVRHFSGGTVKMYNISVQTMTNITTQATPALRYVHSVTAYNNTETELITLCVSKY